MKGVHGDEALQTQCQGLDIGSLKVVVVKTAFECERPCVVKVVYVIDKGKA